MSQCQKKRRTQAEAEMAALTLTAKNEADGHPQPQVYAYPCLLCRGHWHITSQSYHLLAKSKREASENSPPTLPCHDRTGLAAPGPAVPRLDQPGQERKNYRTEGRKHSGQPR